MSHSLSPLARRAPHRHAAALPSAILLALLLSRPAPSAEPLRCASEVQNLAVVRREGIAELVSTDARGANAGPGTVLVPPTSAADRRIAPVTIANGTGAAVWEVTRADPGGIDTLHFGVVVAYLHDAPELGTALVSGFLAPVGGSGESSRTDPVPRFAQPLSPARPAFEVSLGEPCRISFRDTVVGTIPDAAQDDLYAFDALAGTLLSLDLSARSALDLRILDPQLRPVDPGPRLATRRSRTAVRKLPLEETGEYLVSVRNPSGGSTAYQLKLKGVLPKGSLRLRSVVEVNAAGQVLEQGFDAVEGSVLTATLKGKGTDPDVVERLDPSGGALALDPPVFRPGLAAETIRGLLLPETGRYRLRFTGGPGVIDVSVAVKPRGKRKLGECAPASALAARADR